MEFLLKLIITPLILLFSAKYMHTVSIKDNQSAVVASLLIILVGFFIGWLLTLVFNILTLGLFWLIGLGVVTRTLAYAVVIEITDKMMKGFETKGFGPSLALSILLAIGWGIVDNIF